MSGAVRPASRRGAATPRRERTLAEPLDTHRRALAVNLDPTSYGTFAEIGAGQEVARWFLQVGAAAGTVAKTISAYDMAFSDAIYGKSGRYVSRERLVAMLDHEYPLLLQRLGRERGPKSRFFVFADTVSARNYAGTNECHGWMGLRFQARPRARPNDVLLHVNLRDPTNLQQQQALGILGVNLVHAAFFESGKRGRMLDALFGGLSLDRIEIDYVELSGPDAGRADEGAIGVELVRRGLANAVVLERGRSLAPPTELLRKRPVVFERAGPARSAGGTARRLAAAARRLAEEEAGLERPPLALSEISTLAVEGARAPGTASILRRAAEAGRGGTPVLVTRHESPFHVVEYLRRYTKEPVVLAFPASTLVELMRANRDRAKTGRAFEVFGRLLGSGVRMFVEPQSPAELRAAMRRAGLAAERVRFPARGEVGAEDLELQPPADRLLAYLLGAGWIVPLERRRSRSGPRRVRSSPPPHETR